MDAHLSKAALHALRSYQYGNVSPELAEMVADKLEGMEGTPLPSPFFARTLNDSILEARRAIRTGNGVNLALGRLEAAVSGYLDAKDMEMPSLSVAESAILLLEQTLATRPEYKAKGLEDYDRAWKIINAWRGKVGADDSKDLLEALEEAKAALVGDSNDSEHDALVSFVQAMGLEVPECTCDAGGDVKHADDCPQREWQKEEGN